MKKLFFEDYVKAWKYFDQHIMKWHCFPHGYEYFTDGNTKNLIQEKPYGATNEVFLKVVTDQWLDFLKGIKINGVSKEEA